MEWISVFDMFKIGIGPSSSHAVGPWRAAERFLAELTDAGLLSQVETLSVDLYGSLAKTGKGHATDMALQLGLSGCDIETIDVTRIPAFLAEIQRAESIRLAGQHAVRFRPRQDIRFLNDRQLPFHPNGLRFTAVFANGLSRTADYYSIGGGFVIKEGEEVGSSCRAAPYPVSSAAELLAHCSDQQCSISTVAMRNELTWRSEAQIQDGLGEIWAVMLECVHRGCHMEGELPGGLHVMRRAAAISQRLLGRAYSRCDEWLTAVAQQPDSFREVLEWVSCFALAVGEQNAAFGRVVTAPTNGAAGVIPAVLLYYLSYCGGKVDEVMPFLLTSAQIGSIFKQRATISAAQGGCQAEIGVSAAMAAAALTECLNGSAAQSAEAAEIAMEHHLGLTCDPVAGLVQIPCIERNCMGALKAIAAATLALQRDPAEAKVSLDKVIDTMWATAIDMSDKYKETAEGGLAINVPVNLSDC